MGGFPWSHWYLCVLTNIWEWVSGRKRVISRGDPWFCCPVVHVQKLSHHWQIVILIGILWEMYDFLITIKFSISFHCCDSMFSIHYSVERSVTDRKPIGFINAYTFLFLRFCIFISNYFKLWMHYFISKWVNSDFLKELRHKITRSILILLFHPTARSTRSPWK